MITLRDLDNKLEDRYSAIAKVVLSGSLSETAYREQTARLRMIEEMRDMMREKQPETKE